MRATMVGTEVISDAVRLACRAPSLHNSQPWSLAIEGDTVSIFADADRVVRAADSSGREALLACGALLDHFPGGNGRRRIRSQSGPTPPTTHYM